MIIGVLISESVQIREVPRDYNTKYFKMIHSILTLAVQSPIPAAIISPFLLATQLVIVNPVPLLDEEREGPLDELRSTIPLCEKDKLTGGIGKVATSSPLIVYN